MLRDMQITALGAQPELLTIKEAAAMLSCSKDTVRRMMAAGELTRVELTPDAIRVKRAELQAKIDSAGTPTQPQGDAT